VPLIALMAGPALADQPANPGVRGEMVNKWKTGYQTAQGGEKNSWGQHVATRATNKQDPITLGQYLNFMAGGPNPYSGGGTGNNPHN